MILLALLWAFVLLVVFVVSFISIRSLYIFIQLLVQSDISLFWNVLLALLFTVLFVLASLKPWQKKERKTKGIQFTLEKQ